MLTSSASMLKANVSASKYEGKAQIHTNKPFFFIRISSFVVSNVTTVSHETLAYSWSTWRRITELWFMAQLNPLRLNNANEKHQSIPRHFPACVVVVRADVWCLWSQFLKWIKVFSVQIRRETSNLMYLWRYVKSWHILWKCNAAFFPSCCCGAAGLNFGCSSPCLKDHLTAESRFA